MSNRVCESIMEGENESKIPEWAWDLVTRAWDQEMERMRLRDEEWAWVVRQRRDGGNLSEWVWEPCVRKRERGDREWENERDREFEIGIGVFFWV